MIKTAQKLTPTEMIEAFADSHPIQDDRGTKYKITAIAGSRQGTIFHLTANNQRFYAEEASAGGFVISPCD